MAEHHGCVIVWFVMQSFLLSKEYFVISQARRREATIGGIFHFEIYLTFFSLWINL